MSIFFKDLKKYKYVSFDIFDTLVFRNVNKPTDVFTLVEREFNKNNAKKIKDFKSLRISAEKVAREKSKFEEITLDDIYAELNFENKEDIKALELKIEKDIIIKNQEMFDLFEQCLENDMKIIITSDMYLSLNTIKEILDKNGYYGYEKIYLSSELKLTKSTGKIYDYILKDLKIAKEDIIHIGDNLKSDYLKAIEKGIAGIQYNRTKYNIHRYKKSKNEFDYEMLNSFIENTIQENKNYFWKIGYETFGPLLYSYVTWLKENFEEKNYEKVFFLARDGYIMQKAFNLLEGKDIPNEYMYASRRALIVPTLWMCKDLDEMLNSMFLGNKISVNALVKRLGLEPKEQVENLKKNNLSLDTSLKVNEINENKDFLSFYEIVREDIIKNSKEEYENLLKYYKQIGFEGKVAIVDIGWFGNMQNALNNIIKKADLKVNLAGYYVGVIPDSKNQEVNEMHGFLFEKNKNEYLALEKKFFNSIFEMIFLSTHGSVKKYNGKKDIVDCYEFEYEDSDTEKLIREIQVGAIDFIKKVVDSNTYKYLELNEKIAFYNMLSLGNYPRIADTEQFGDMLFYDDDIFYLARPKRLRYYILHPKVFYKEFMNSAWMPGFLKRLFKINLSYFKFILLLRKLKKD